MPVGPVGPVAPVGPVEPVGPVDPVMPVGPVVPVGPVNPRGPIGPCDPVAPVFPVVPVPNPRMVVGVIVNVFVPSVRISKFVVRPVLNKKFVEIFIVPSPIALFGASKISLAKRMSK
jgi:hypothetical protein